MNTIYLDVLKKECVPAQGCTEPIAVAYASALCADLLQDEITQIELYLSSNVIKNALGVGIPGTGRVGIDISCALGAVIKKPENSLEILSNFTKDELTQANAMLEKQIITTHQKLIDEKLYIEVVMQGVHHQVKLIIACEHTNVIYIEKDHEIIKNIELCLDNLEEVKHAKMSIKDIYEFATTVDFSQIEFMLEGAYMNTLVSKEGLKGGYGLEVGNKITLGSNKNILTHSISNQIVAATAAASDARMDGCSLPIMTTAGSGNQGIACTMPVVELARLNHASDEQLARALVISNLIVCHIKEYMGRLSPMCGAAIAGATGACCGITYLMGGDLIHMNHAIHNMLADMTGLLCDGAKTTCALKIATATNAAIQCSTLAMNGISPTSNEGIIFEDVEDTVKHIGTLIRDGLKGMDATILDIMLHK